MANDWKGYALTYGDASSGVSQIMNSEIFELRNRANPTPRFGEIINGFANIPPRKDVLRSRDSADFSLDSKNLKSLFTQKQWLCARLAVW